MNNPIFINYKLRFWILLGLITIFAGFNIESQTSRNSQQKESPMIKALPKYSIGGMSLEATILARRSVRKFSSEKLSENAISSLLFSAYGITDEKKGFHSVPSAGATFPLEVYLVTSEGIEKYKPKGHFLEKIKDGDFREKLSQACLGQDFIAQAPISIVLTGVYERTTYRYGERGIRYVHMEAGHVAQNISLQAVSLGLGAVCVGAFHDKEVEELIGCNKREKALYVIPIGKPKP